MIVRGGVPTADLPAQFGPDRSACTGDENPLTRQIACDGGDVGVDLSPAQQIGQVDVTHVFDSDAAMAVG